MSKKKKEYDKNRPVSTCSKHVLWFIESLDDGKVLFEKFNPNQASEYDFYEIEEIKQFPSGGDVAIPRYKLNVRKGVNFFSCEICNLKRFFGRFNTFSHMEKSMDLPEAVMRTIVYTEDREEYDRINGISVAAEAARKIVEERGRDYNISTKNSENEYS